MRWLDSITKAMDMNLGKLREMVRDREAGVLQSTRAQRVGHDNNDNHLGSPFLTTIL